MALDSLADGKEESIKLFLHRWEKLEKDFYNKKKDYFDVSKIPDIYDQLKYDVYHNSHLNLPEVREPLLPFADRDRLARCLRWRRLWRM